jgi:putative aminopeptidase FrvX
MEAEERKKVSQIKDFWIDIGAKDSDEAKEMVRVGDMGSWIRASSRSPTDASPPAPWTTG